MRYIILLLLISFGYSFPEEKWSWGKDGKDAVREIVFVDTDTRNVATGKKLLLLPEEGKGDPGTEAKSSQRKGRKITSPDAETEGRRDGKTEGRLNRIRKELCKVGIGSNCPKGGYDLLELEDPYGYQPSYPVQQPSNHYGSSGIDPQQVLAVQPVALQPVGTPIQAVPIGPSGNGIGGGYGGVTYGGGLPPSPGYGGISYGGSYGISSPISAPISSGPVYSAGPSYSAPIASPGPVYSAPSYSVPSASYGISPGGPAYATAYSPPSHKSEYSEVDFSSSSGTFDLDNSYEERPRPRPRPIQKDFPVEPQVVKHYHTHTHIYKDNGGSGSSLYNGGSGSSLYNGGLSFNSRPPRSHTLPIVKPSSQVLSSFYREDCECVPTYFCSLSDVVGRSDLPLLDARNRPTNILSTAKDEPRKTSSSEKKRVVVKASKEEINKKKTKREVKTNFKVFNGTEKVQGRQAFGSPRIRNKNSSQRCPRGEVCCSNPGFSSRALSYNCGKKNSAGVLGRVRNAKIEKQLGDTEFGEYPWQAAILQRESNEIVYVCGAALVNDKHALTAAHCVNNMNAEGLKIRLGEWDVNRKTEFYDYIETDIKRLIIHPEFYSGTLTNDIAIIVLEDSVDFSKNPHINPVCLPHTHSDFMNRHCHVTGWGKDAFGNDGDFQFILKEVEVPVWGNKGCESALKKTRLGINYKLDDGMLCAGGEEGKDACKGDGGGPLVCSGSDGSMELAGLVSWGIGCGESGIPGVYVNVPHYMDWITEILKTVR